MVEARELPRHLRASGDDVGGARRRGRRGRRARALRRPSAAQAWGLILIAPYALVFLIFVLYPVCYGLWLARQPQTYARLFADPIFSRAVSTRSPSSILGINLKMLVALFLSGFFVTARWWIRWLSALFILPVGGALDSDDPVGSLHAQSGMGRRQPADLSSHRPGRPELAQRSRRWR